ncbi:MAG: C4-dicarboxylate ABC transporter substrate-binding protein, partial [Rhodospirillales bacterium]|nr:C4-dicarboxylate ABC transporter substrate-binding protein [Rhodospirillales bacterium]
MHVFVRPEIKNLEDLAGKPVNFNTHGTAAAYSGPIIFERLGIKVQPQFTPHPVAMAEMAKSDKYAAVVFVSAKPLDPFV